MHSTKRFVQFYSLSLLRPGCFPVFPHWPWVVIPCSSWWEKKQVMYSVCVCICMYIYILLLYYIIYTYIYITIIYIYYYYIIYIFIYNHIIIDVSTLLESSSIKHIGLGGRSCCAAGHCLRFHSYNGLWYNNTNKIRQMPTAVEEVPAASSHAKRCCLHFQNWFQGIVLGPLAIAAT